MNYKYNHTQIGYLMLYLMVAVIIIFTLTLAQTGFSPQIILTMLFIIIIILSFSTLNVKIDNTHLKLKFGYGLFFKKFILRDIESVKIVKNKWYYGWGIKMWGLFPMTWIFNVSGFDAIEIKMKSGRLYRIGTDEPQKLEKAILDAIKR